MKLAKCLRKAEDYYVCRGNTEDQNFNPNNTIFTIITTLIEKADGMRSNRWYLLHHDQEVSTSMHRDNKPFLLVHRKEQHSLTNLKRRTQ